MRQKLDTILRRALALWRSSLHSAIVGEDALGMGASTIFSWTPTERLERFEAFARASMSRSFNIAPKINRVAHEVFSRGYRLAYSERQKKVPSDEPSLTVSSLYGIQIMNEVRGVLESSLAHMTRTISIGVTTQQRTTKIYSRVLQVLKKIASHRLQTISHTAVSRAYNHGKLDAYQVLGVERVGVIIETLPPELPPRPINKVTIVPRQVTMADARRSRERTVAILTAGDDRVCDICEELEGQVFTLSEARDVLPAHENCRCTFVPEDDFEEEMALREEEGGPTSELRPGTVPEDDN